MTKLDVLSIPIVSVTLYHKFDFNLDIDFGILNTLNISLERFELELPKLIDFICRCVPFIESVPGRILGCVFMEANPIDAPYFSKHL